MNSTFVIKRPIITEKSLEATKENRFTFEVDVRATKDQVKAAIKQMFDVDVISIRTISSQPISISTGRKRLPSQTSKTKKAIVEIKEGQTIKVFETRG